MKAFKRYSAAKQFAEGQPMLRLGSGNKNILYIAGLDAIDEITLIAADGRITGHITLQHLDRLGNANWAQSGGTGKDYAFGRAFRPDAK